MRQQHSATIRSKDKLEQDVPATMKNLLLHSLRPATCDFQTCDSSPSASLGDLCAFDSVALRPCQQASLILMFANAHKALRLTLLSAPYCLTSEHN
jgi:hypothetical protein